MQKIVALSVTEAELVTAVICVQHMLYVLRLLESIGLLVEYPMEIEIDNSGAIDLDDNWSVGGRTKHMHTIIGFSRESKEEGMLNVVWKKGINITDDMFTNNLAGPDFTKCSNDFIGDICIE